MRGFRGSGSNFLCEIRFFVIRHRRAFFLLFISFFLRVLRYASENVDSVDVYGATAANALAARSAKRQSWVVTSFDRCQDVENHCSAFVRVDREFLHPRLSIILLRVPSVNPDGLFSHRELSSLLNNIYVRRGWAIFWFNRWGQYENDEPACQRRFDTHWHSLRPPKLQDRPPVVRPPLSAFLTLSFFEIPVDTRCPSSSFDETNMATFSPTESTTKIAAYFVHLYFWLNHVFDKRHELQCWRAISTLVFVF